MQNFLRDPKRTPRKINRWQNKLDGERQLKSAPEENDYTGTESDQELKYIREMKRKRYSEIMVTEKLNGTESNMELDTGASETLCSEQDNYIRIIYMIRT